MVTLIRSFLPDEWQLWKSLRLQALADSPNAFGSTLDGERQQIDSHWTELIASSSLADRDFLLAERDGRPVGMARVGPSEGDASQAGLFSMWVMPSERGLGVGRALVDAAIDWARSKGVSEVILHVTEGNDEAKRLYLSSGFIGTGVRLPLRPGSNLFEEVMVLKLC
ncbi:GNAT family N-acetyltransferase [Limnochorda pilosa]|uniref:Acetyltransferase n=1 Tax=Limnochorda pilosa TaxID=1555112 RepID=A0A0K2SIA6_LIMPI|nr:GNAT family N-acetyltransferase [Limnochorda pilosa]BAS26747.1 acetyltransferase [Limnochorda pilosa]